MDDAARRVGDACVTSISSRPLSLANIADYCTALTRVEQPRNKAFAFFAPDAPKPSLFLPPPIPRNKAFAFFCPRPPSRIRWIIRYRAINALPRPASAGFFLCPAAFSAHKCVDELTQASRRSAGRVPQTGAAARPARCRSPAGPSRVDLARALRTRSGSRRTSGAG
jgi:hypothetical protein